MSISINTLLYWRIKIPRLSLWKDGAHSNDYKYLDKNISEQFTVGGTGILVNKYLGPTAQGTQLALSAPQSVGSTTLLFSNTSGANLNDFVFGTGITPGTRVVAMNAASVTLSLGITAALVAGATVGFSPDATNPSYTNQSAQNIQDLLWVENRDRKYDTSVYKMRGIYQRGDQDFDLSQFGLFLQTGTIFMVFHLRDMVDILGRKLVSGDVLELQHLKDYDALDGDIPAALKRYYVVGDASFASEGFSPTWWPHLWRVKLNPMVDSQEYKDILNNLSAGDAGNTPVGKILSTYDTYLNINQAVIQQAETDVPKSGYDILKFYTLPTNPDSTYPEDDAGPDADNPSPKQKIKGYLAGDGLAPNGLPMQSGIEFPQNPVVGNYYLRLDYLPNRLFRFDGKLWRKVEDAVRTNITPGDPNNQTQRAGFVNNTNTFTDSSGQTHAERQMLSRILTPKADN